MTYQLFTVGYLPTVVVTSNRESGFDSGEGALEIATTSKEGSRHFLLWSSSCALRVLVVREA